VDTVFLVILVWSVLRSVRGFMGGSRRNPGRRVRQDARSAGPSSTGGNTARDPVCGMFVSTEVSHRLSENGKVLHFCSEKCLHAYQKSAARAS
jgi:YHS domain-containing protein